ncbi:hypothetical protein [Salinivibrio costicola]|uniref:hypothetical protein n=1 Tax=Salinivibrio costicola TaxID=51367 RepID=UPI0003956FA2|nr:hypothetical protein [Salinivibrio costicola]
MSRIRGPYVRFCERDEAATPHPTRYIGDISAKNKKAGLGPLSQYDDQALTLKA